METATISKEDLKLQLLADLQALNKSYKEKKAELQKKLDELGEKVLFFHSKPEHDPLGKGKRLTVCGIISNNQMKIGIAKLNHKDVFKKIVGRDEAYKKATASTEIIDVIPGKTNKQFIKVVKDILKNIRSEKELEIANNAKIKIVLKHDNINISN